MEFTFSEYADMHLMYGLAACNAVEAKRLYAERFPDRRLPDRKTFERVDRRLRETGTFAKAKHNCGNQVNRNAVAEEDILNAVEADPSISVRKLSARFHCQKSTVFRIVKEQQLHPYHLQKVHALLPEDLPRRMEFSNWLLRMHTNNANFVGSVMFTDEAGFSKHGVINSHNLHLWAEENPHAFIVTHHQHQFQPINVWAGIIGQHLIGPYVLPNRLTGALYLEFLQNNLPELLEDLPLAIRQAMWFMHDGAPPHFSLAVREHLNTQFGQRWIGRGGPVAWPPRSPDFNPLDYFFWGYLKTLVYANPVDTREDLLERINFHCGQIRANVQALWRTQQSTIIRARECIRLEGAHVEPTYKIVR